MSAPLLHGSTETFREMRSAVTMPGTPVIERPAGPGTLPGMTGDGPTTRTLRRARTLAMRRIGAWSMRREMANAVFLSAVESGERIDHKCDSGCLNGCPLPADQEHSSRLFPCAADQVRVVRAFVRKRLAGHPARDDAVLVASEIAANAVDHGASPRLLVHVTEVSATHAAVLITEWGVTGKLTVMDADADSESGRGLALVRSLSFFVRVGGKGDARNILTVVPADPPVGDVRRCRARDVRRLAQRTARARSTT